MKLVGTVLIMNRLAQAHGHGANSKLGRACKSVVQVRERSDGRHVLLVSTRKDAEAYEYPVKKIENLRTKLINDGFATIDISEPPMSIMLQKCDPRELKAFMKYLHTLSKAPFTNPLSYTGKDVKCPDPDKNDKVDRSPLEPQQPPVEQNQQPDGEVPESSMRRSTGAVKRRRSTEELSKANKEVVKKCLLSTNFQITVSKRENYPKEFSPSVKEIKFGDIGLVKIDSRILKLKQLSVLQIEGNFIKDISKLTQLSCELTSLSIAINRVGNIPDDFFDFPCLRKLTSLDLSNNELTSLPSSFERLESLAVCRLNGNKLKYLPYNLGGLKKLQVLDVSKNLLEFIPASISLIGLTKLDMDENPAVQGPFYEKKHNFVGYATLPTLFEITSEVIMNNETCKRQLCGPLPSIIPAYVRGGKYCMTCGKQSLRYKVTSSSMRSRELCKGKMEACLIAPVSMCNVKTIICHSCDKRMAKIASRRVRVVLNNDGFVREHVFRPLDVVIFLNRL